MIQCCRGSGNPKRTSRCSLLPTLPATRQGHVTSSGQWTVDVESVWVTSGLRHLRMGVCSQLFFTYWSNQEATVWDVGVTGWGRRQSHSCNPTLGEWEIHFYCTKPWDLECTFYPSIPQPALAQLASTIRTRISNFHQFSLNSIKSPHQTGKMLPRLNAIAYSWQTFNAYLI